jgi:uncharacterized protein YbbK (DUF523 family)
MSLPVLSGNISRVGNHKALLKTLCSQTTYPQQKIPRIAISSCLLGEKVRYDGNDKKIEIISLIPDDLVKFIPVCPEVATGMGIPRPPIQIIETASGLEARQVDDPGKNFTEALTCYGKKMAQELKDISGYIFKARSPSCGVQTTLVTRRDYTEYFDSGLYAKQILEHLPDLPVTDEEGVTTPEAIAAFLGRALDYSGQKGCMDSATVTLLKKRVSQYIHDIS